MLYTAALIAGISYFFSDALAVAGPVHLVWKGAGVGLLAAWAAARARSADGRLAAGAFALYAAADVLIEFGRTIGALGFIAGHLAMMTVLLRQRVPVGAPQRGLAWLVLVAVPLVAFVLPASRSDGAQVAVYAAFLGGMAAAAAASRFPPRQVALGAALFVISDWLIFSRLGPLALFVIPDLLVWPTYFAGQALLAWGVVRGLEQRS